MPGQDFYSTSYASLLEEIEAALNAKAEVTGPKVSFTGFPANLGEAGVEMTLGALGTIVSFDAVVSDDGLVLGGMVEFEDLETAKKVRRRGSTAAGRPRVLGGDARRGW